MLSRARQLPDAPESGVWALRDYRLLWLGDAVSAVGSQVTMNALPLIALLSLHGSGSALGWLRVLYMVPFLLFALPAGLWLERARQRQVMVAMDLGRAALALTVPVAAWLGVLGWTQLCLVAVLGGAMTVVSELALPAYLSRLVGPGRLAAGNSGLHVNLATSSTVGPGVTGWLIGLVGATTALLVDVLSYLVSATALLLIRGPRDPVPAPPVVELATARRGTREWRGELRDGFRAVWRNPPVRQIALAATISSFGVQFVSVACVVRLVADLGISTGWFGAAAAMGGAGGVLGTLGAPPAIRRLGYGRVLLYGSVLAALPCALFPLSADPELAVVLSCAGFFLLGLGGGATGTAEVTLRHLLTHSGLHARMNSVFRLAQFTAIPVGSAVAGILVDRVGARGTLWICPVVMLVALIPVLAREVRALSAVDPAG
ncbi:MFS transporter [Streptomyces lavendulae subsp. lavendulae]|uniref:MFS transporter n=1 Tax=Streptomyces lavendulae TaxID=1914 RepID=UPI0024A40DC4|nr:MFS transporter [Streptomyces lavendulae]GLV84816.1 MFS transporter [Streptomyces lavendulae subsp. lavendulae]